MGTTPKNKPIDAEYLLNQLKNLDKSILEAKYVQEKDIKDTYTATDENPISGKGVSVAVNALQQDINGKSEKGHKHTKSEITDFPTSMTPTAHNQASNTINAMTDYAKATSASAITTTDTLNVAIGKLEKALDEKANSSHTHTELMSKNNPTGTGSFSLNRKADTTIGDYSFAEGDTTTASRYASHAEGDTTTASGYASHAEGSGTTASEFASHAEGGITTASGHGSHAEGSEVTASGYASHAEGNGTLASGSTSHAEGQVTTASGDYSHAEGYSGNLITRIISGYSTSTSNDDILSAWKTKKFSVAHGTYSHVEGENCLALGSASHSEGNRTTTSEQASHSEGINTIASGSASHSEGGNTTASGPASHAEGTNTTASGDSSHAEGQGTIASASYTHSEGVNTSAIGQGSHAEGSNLELNRYNEIVFEEPRRVEVYDKATDDFINITVTGSQAFGLNSHAEGCSTLAYGKNSHTEGYHTVAAANESHAEGCGCEANASFAHAEGIDTEARGDGSHAEGFTTTASGTYSHAEGFSTIASGKYSHAEGYYTKAANYVSHASGKYNAAMTTGGGAGNTTGTAFVIGNGTGSSALSNAFSVQYNGIVKAKSTITASTTADYAEFFEWLDGNPDDEDRVGYFVTLDGDKIRIATAADDYILGVVSGEPFVLGNGDCDTWNGMYLHDEFRRTIYEPAPKMIEILDSEGNPTGEYKEAEGEFEGTRPKLNPEYDHTKSYISRFDRKEWAPVGMLGVLAVRHDGTAKVNGYVTVNADGIATACEKSAENAYRVIKSNTDSVVEIIFR